jgi:hypothetical protein
LEREEKRRRFERILAFRYVSEDSKYASEYPENVSK